MLPSSAQTARPGAASGTYLVKCLVALALIVLMPFSFRAANAPAGVSFDTANRLYEEGKFTEAAAAYEQVLNSGQTSAAVYYNLGNAFFKAGQIGRAIAAYHQAEQITPRDPDLRANLQFARNQVQGPTISTPTWKRWLGRATLNEWTLFAGAVLWIWLLLLTLWQWRPALKSAVRPYSAVSGAVFALACAVAVVSWNVNHSARIAIVVAREAVVRQGPLDEARTSFTLHDGAELQVLDHKDDWLQVTTDPRRIGWVRRDQVILAPSI